MTAYKILVVDDKDFNLISTRLLLQKWGYEVDTALGGDAAIEMIKKPDAEYAVVLLDYRMPDKNGAVTAREIREINKEPFIIIFSGDDSREAIKETWMAGAVAFLEKDADPEDIRHELEYYCRKFEDSTRTLKFKKLNNTNEELISTLGMVGQSDAMAKVGTLVKKYRLSKEPVLILGETGVGKELVAKALHSGHKELFRAINCASYKDNAQLLESELFGYEKGSFTGANAMGKVGLLEAARNGTVLLDEVHWLSLDAQGKLLRALQEKKIRRVGGNQEHPIEVRIIAACKPGIERAVEEGSFLPDLYYRLNVLTITVPPLRDRKEDIQPLVAHFCDKYSEQAGEKRSLLMKTVRIFEEYPWRGNIRELENAIKKLMIEVSERTIGPKHLEEKFKAQLHPSGGESRFTQLERRQEQERRDLLMSALSRTKFASQAALWLGLPTSTMYDLLEKFGISKNAKAEPPKLRIGG